MWGKTRFGININRHRILLVEPPFYRLFKDTFALTQYSLAPEYLAGPIELWYELKGKNRMTCDLIL